MPDTPTPGQICYAGYVLARHGMPADDAALTYGRSVPDERAAWEAAAAAVQDLVRRELLAGFAQARVEGQRTTEEDTPSSHSPAGTPEASFP